MSIPLDIPMSIPPSISKPAAFSVPKYSPPSAPKSIPSKPVINIASSLSKPCPDGWFIRNIQNNKCVCPPNSEKIIKDQTSSKEYLNKAICVPNLPSLTPSSK
jgi:hypothetical protein